MGRNPAAVLAIASAANACPEPTAIVLFIMFTPPYRFSTTRSFALRARGFKATSAGPGGPQSGP
ncbi:MAG: hypothetical protein AAB576_10355, partial [Elusimicrobiota bacterium]